MAEFRDISEFSLKPVLDGTEEIQISAENKTTLLQIAKLVLGELFKLDSFEEITQGFSKVEVTDTLMKALQKLNLGFSNGQAKVITGNTDVGYGIGLTSRNAGAFAYFPDLETIYFRLSQDMDLGTDDELLQDIYDNEDYSLFFPGIMKENLVGTTYGATSLVVSGGEVIDASGGATTLTTINLGYFTLGISSAVVYGLTSTTPPTLNSISTIRNIYKASNWGSIWAQTGTKVITFQAVSANSILVNVGLYVKQ